MDDTTRSASRQAPGLDILLRSELASHGMRRRQDDHPVWPASARKLLKRFPSYLPSRAFLWLRVWDSLPKHDAPLAERLAWWLLFARVQWSHSIEFEGLQTQFEVWLPEFLDSDGAYWLCAPGFVEVRETMRLACGLSRFAATRVRRFP
jgi:hypothetical protein